LKFQNDKSADKYLSADIFLKKAGKIMSKNSSYVNTPIKESNITDLYIRLNAARANNSLDPLPLPSLVDSAITASQINQTINDIFATKSASVFLSELDLPFTVTVG
jgi:hypothetical protein